MRIRALAAAAVMLGATALSTTVAVTPSAASTPICVPKIGTKTPVVFVHGFNSSPKIWDELVKDIKHDVPDAYIDSQSEFDYSGLDSLKWVNDKHIGPALADRIACLAASSKHGHGLGKVILVVHSMGGLATRWAATEASNAKEVAGDIGLVVTLGTPNSGSGLANLGAGLKYAICTPTVTDGREVPVPSDSPCATLNALDAMQNYSPQMSSLPKMPSGIAVEAIAGDVTLTVPLFHTTITDTGNDLVVAKTSALHGNVIGGVGGTQTINCSAVVFKAFGAACWHSALTHNPIVESKVIHTVQNYLAAATSFAKDAGTWLSPSAGIEMTVSANGTGVLDPGVHASNVRFTPTSKGLNGKVTSVKSDPRFPLGNPLDLTFPTAYGGITASFGHFGDPAEFFRETKLSSSVLKPFVGGWYVHGGGLTISANSTGTITWNDGPCSDTSLDLCQGTAKVMFDSTSGKDIVGVITSADVTLNGQEPPDFVDDMSEPQPGYVFKLQYRSNPKALYTTWGEDAADASLNDGNRNWCANGVTYSDSRCGA